MKTLAWISFVIFPVLAHAKTDAEYAFCMGHVLDKYLPRSQAEIVCAMSSNTEVGCGMDLVDMGQFAGLIEAVEYCRSPMGDGH